MPDGMASPPHSMTCSSTAMIVSLLVFLSLIHIRSSRAPQMFQFIAAQFLMLPFQIFHSPALAVLNALEPKTLSSALFRQFSSLHFFAIDSSGESVRGKDEKS